MALGKTRRQTGYSNRERGFKQVWKEEEAEEEEEGEEAEEGRGGGGAGSDGRADTEGIRKELGKNPLCLAAYLGKNDCDVYEYIFIYFTYL